MTKIPLFSGAREFAANRSEILNRIEAVLEIGDVSGAAVTALERRLASMAERKYAVAVNSGTDALYFALIAVGVEPGDEVLLPDFSFVSSGSAVVRARARAIFADVDETFNMDLALAVRYVTARTRAMICVHLYGQMSDPVRVEAFAQSRRLLLIEDAAQTVGATFGDRPAGLTGRVSCFSFNATKTISAPGGGGAVLTDDQPIADRVRRLRYHGKAEDGRSVELGYNSLMSNFTAAVLDFKLDQDHTWQARRHEIVAYYRNRWKERDDLLLPPIVAGTSHNYHKLVVRSPRRDALAAHLGRLGIETKVHYPLPLHLEPVFHDNGQDKDCLYPNALHFASTVLTIPAHAFLTDGEVEAIAEAVRGF